MTSPKEEHPEDCRCGCKLASWTVPTNPSPKEERKCKGHQLVGGSGTSHCFGECQVKQSPKEPEEEWKEGDKVVICDGVRTGMFGVVGGLKGESVAVCLGSGHDCDGVCPNGGTYEPGYALLLITEKNKKSIDLMIAHLSQAKSQGAREALSKAAEEVKEMFFVFPDGGIHDFDQDEELVSKKQVLSILQSNLNKEKNKEKET